MTPEEIAAADAAKKNGRKKGMTAELVARFEAAEAHGVVRLDDDIDLATARQRDSTQVFNKLLDGFISAELFRSDDPAQFAGLNAGVRIPTTLDHPNAVVGKGP